MMVGAPVLPHQPGILLMVNEIQMELKEQPQSRIATDFLNDIIIGERPD
jgi:hypothetical protein